MSSHVTIRTTTTTSTSAILLNIGYYRTPAGILKLLQVVLGAICVGLTAMYFSPTTHSHLFWTSELFFLLMATTCLIATTLLLISYTISIASATILPKTIFEAVYHLFAALMLLVSGAIYLMRVTEYKGYIRYYDGRVAASVLGIINAILYGIALFFSCRQYRNM